MARSQAEYQQLLQNPNVRGVLAAIRHGEGTTDGYNIMFGGGRFNDYSRHPDRVVNTNGYSSSAAGAYQFLTPTWNEAQKALGLKDFSPASQDLAALYLIDRRGALDEAANAGFTSKVSDRLAPEWASLPTAAGKSYYGQPVKSFSELQKIATGKGGGTGGQPSGSTQSGGGFSYTPPDAPEPIDIKPTELTPVHLDPAIEGIRAGLLDQMRSTLGQMGYGGSNTQRMAGSDEFTARLKARIGQALGVV